MTSTQEEKTGQTAIGRWFVHNPWPLIVFIIAFTVGSRALKQIVTPDELAWVFRSIHFRQALSQQDWPNIVQSGHPGFITMWLGTVGTTIKLWLQPELQSEIDWILQQNWRLPSSGELSHRLYPFLRPARNIISLFMAGLWTAVYFLIKQRVGKEIAPLALLFLITDIWIIGLTHILHVDGLLAMFCLLTLLLVLPRRDDDLQFYGRRRYLLTGVAIAGAILTKVPGLLLLAIVPGILVMQWWFQRRSQRRSQRKKGLFTALTFVFIGLLATLALFAPVIFINPTYVFQRIFVQGSREVGFSAPTFFLGQITENPGLFFYPLVIFFRQRALITIGLIIASVQLIRTKDGRNQWFFMSAVGAFCLLFWLGLLVSDREFDRYIFPAALPISMIGAVSIAKFVKQFTNNKLVIIAISLSLLANLYYYEKDPFSMINPLVGGPWNGSSLMLTGWGGGQSYAAKEISLTPNTLLLTDNVPATAPFVAYPNNVLLLTPQTAWLGEFDDVVILSLEHQQLNPHDWLPNSVNFPASQQGRPIRYAGVDRAWLFSDFDQDFLNQGVSRYDSADFNFNNSLKLSEATAIKPDDDFNIHLLLRWAYAQPEDGVLQFTIVDAANNVWIQREDPLINIEDVPASLWTPNANYLSIHSLPLASDMPPGDYSVRVSHFRTDGSLSGITHTDEFIGTVATLATFLVIVPSPQLPVALPENGQSQGLIQAVAELPAAIGQGETLAADVWLKQEPAEPKTDTLLLTVGEQTLHFPVNTTDWQTGFVYRVRAKWQIPADLAPGEQPIRLNGLELSTLTVEKRERNFELPAGITVQSASFGSVAKLIAVEPDLTNPVTVRIVWQAIDPDRNDYAMFIHLKDSQSNIVAQQDLPPGKPTSQVISGEVIDFTTEITLEGTDPSQITTIAIGLYNPTSGQRVPVISKSGEQLLNDQVEITIGADAN